jgi:hypothetical protein
MPVSLVYSGVKGVEGDVTFLHMDLQLLHRYHRLYQELNAYHSQNVFLVHFKHTVNILRTGDLNLWITLGTGDFKATTLNCALFTLKINIEFPN